MWLKVCNAKSPSASIGLHIVALKLTGDGTTPRNGRIIRACFPKTGAKRIAVSKAPIPEEFSA